MKTIAKLNLTLILSFVICSGSFSQPISVDCNGKVGINGSPHSSHALRVNGTSVFTNTISASKINSFNFSAYRFFLANQTYSGYLDIWNEYNYSTITIMKGSYTHRALDVFGPVRIDGGSQSTRVLDVIGTAWLNGNIQITSDENLKKNITSLEGTAILEKINNIEGKKYKFKNSQEMLALHNSGQVHFSVDTINIYREAINLASDDEAFAFESENMDHTEREIYLRDRYLETAKQNSGIQNMINDSIGIVVRVPHYPNKETLGLLAQEVIKEFPELVEMDSLSGVYGINYDGFIPVLLEAIKAQQQQITTQQQEIEELKNAVFGSKTKSVELIDIILPASQNTLSQNTPNPFSDNTEIAYFLSDEVRNAAIYVYDMNGRQIKSIPLYSKGHGYITIYGNELKAGMYMYSLIADGQLVDTKRMILTE